MNAERKIIPIHSQAQTHAEYIRDTKLRDIRQRYGDFYQKLSARMQMEQSRVNRQFDAGRFDR